MCVYVPVCMCVFSYVRMHIDTVCPVSSVCVSPPASDLESNAAAHRPSASELVISCTVCIRILMYIKIRMHTVHDITNSDADGL